MPSAPCLRKPSENESSEANADCLYPISGHVGREAIDSKLNSHTRRCCKQAIEIENGGTGRAPCDWVSEQHPKPLEGGRWIEVEHQSVYVRAILNEQSIRTSACLDGPLSDLVEFRNQQSDLPRDTNGCTSVVRWIV